jgi:hypothetical protein
LTSSPVSVRNGSDATRMPKHRPDRGLYTPGGRSDFARIDLDEERLAHCKVVRLAALTSAIANSQPFAVLVRMR